MKHHRIEIELFAKGLNSVCGLDEAGRGPIAGPVVAAAVSLPEAIDLKDLNDSKLLTAEKREELFKMITGNADWGIGVVTHDEIDKIGILEATQKAFQMAVKDLDNRPEYLLVDGRDAFFFDIPYVSVVRGDLSVRCIAAASIVAKVVRDRIMGEYGKKFPQYSFRKHKGYGTKAHFKELAEFGSCEIHRKTFHPVNEIDG
ncbi:MAG: ribonuclease HII [Patescibacteria group bacterium]